jgi:hypothetical protein
MDIPVSVHPPPCALVIPAMQVLSVDKATGVIRVSRKALLHPKKSIPDELTPAPAPAPASFLHDIETLPLFPAGLDLNPESLDLQQEPTEPEVPFPMTPPRPYSKQFFSQNVASAEDIEKAMSNAKSPTLEVKTAESGPLPHKGGKGGKGNRKRK